MIASSFASSSLVFRPKPNVWPIYFIKNIHKPLGGFAENMSPSPTEANNGPMSGILAINFNNSGPFFNDLLRSFSFTFIFQSITISRVFNNCSAERLSRLAILQMEAGQRENRFEEYFKLLQQNRFDENTSIDQLEQIIKYFQVPNLLKKNFLFFNIFNY